MVRACTIFNGPVTRDGSPFVRRRFTRRLGVRRPCKHILTPVGSFVGALGTFFDTNNGNTGIAIPFGRRTFTETSRLARQTTLTNTIGALGQLRSKHLLNSGASNVNLLDSLRHLSFVHPNLHVLLVNTNKTSHNMLLPLLSLSYTIAVAGQAMSHTRRLTGLFTRANDVRTLNVSRLRNRRFSLVVGTASDNVDNSVPTVPSSLVRPNVCYCSVFCRGKGAPFLT